MIDSRSSVRFATLLHRFFCEQLMNQRSASPQTVASYRDTFCLLLNFIQDRYKVETTAICLEHLNADAVVNFLQYLEEARGNSIRTRNARLAAIRSFLHYAVAFEPAMVVCIQRTLTIPMKRFERPTVHCLSQQEVAAILDATDIRFWSGRRDRVLFRTLYNTGARISEIIGTKIMDYQLNRSPCVIIHGKGRKERVIPLFDTTVRSLRTWLKEIGDSPTNYMFPDARGQALTRSGAQYRLSLTVNNATKICPSLNGKKISPHTIRHSTALHLLQSGVDLATIALWLGHESPVTTHMYMEADLAMKERALQSLSPPNTPTGRYHPPDKLLQFLKSL